MKSSTVESSRTDVLIIGAGAAGLAAARALATAGIRFKLIEARNQIGGRLRTQYLPDHPLPVELGAEFVHGKPPELWKILRAANLTRVAVPDAHRLLLRDGKLEPAPRFWEELGEVFQHLRKPGRGASEDRSFSDFLRARKAGGEEQKLELARSFVEGFHAADLERVSEQSLAIANESMAGSEGTRVFRIQEGYLRLALWMFESLERAGEQVQPEDSLHLNTVVQELHWRRGQVGAVTRTATGRARVFHAERAIITLPVGVLRSGAVRFLPEPREHSKALGFLEMGDVCKVILKFKEKFWDSDELRELSFVHAGADPSIRFPTWWSALPVEAPILTAWSGGPQASRLCRMPANLLLHEALVSLERFLGKPLGLSRGKLEELLSSWHFHNWREDPFSLGSYSYLLSGGVPAQKRLSEPVEDTLYFAGEATHGEGLLGTVDGAIETGTRAARQVLEMVGPTFWFSTAS